MKDLKKKLMFGALSGLFVGIYSKFWSGWWYAFDFVIAAAGVYFVYLLVRDYMFRDGIKIKGDVLGLLAVCDLLNCAQEWLKFGVVLYPRKEKR